MSRKVLLSAISLLIACLTPLCVAKSNSGITHALLIHEYDADTIQGSQIDLCVYPISPSVNQVLHVTAKVQNSETLIEDTKVGFYANGTFIDNKPLDSSGVAKVSYIPKTLGFYTFTALIFGGAHIYYGKVTVQVGEPLTGYTPYILISAIILGFILIVACIVIQRPVRASKIIQ